VVPRVLSAVLNCSSDLSAKRIIVNREFQHTCVHTYVYTHRAITTTTITTTSTVQAVLCRYVFVHLSKCARWLIGKTPPAQVAGDDHHECKSNLEGKRRQHKTCRELVMTIFHGHKHILVSSQMQVAQEKGNDYGGGDGGGGSVYSKYRSTARNYHNSLCPSISKFSCKQLCTQYVRGLRERLEQVCNALGIDQDSLKASQDTTADPHESENMHTRREQKRLCE